MPFSLRLDPATEARIRELMMKTGWSKANVVREAVAQYRVDASAREGTTLYDRLKPYIGVVSSGRRDGSQNTHAKVRALIKRKLRERRSR